MQEVLPIILGLFFGLLSTSGSLPGPRTVWFIAGCVAAGAIASFVNGEMTSSLAGLLLGLDALLAWCGATAGVAALGAYRAYARRGER
jgi:hypothetical protein